MEEEELKKRLEAIDRSIKEKFETVDEHIAELKESILTRNFNLKMKAIHYAVTGLVASFIFASIVTYTLQNMEEHLPTTLFGTGVVIGFFYIVILSLCEPEE